MKSLLVLVVFLCAIKPVSAQTVCDSISVDTVYVDANSFNITVYNSSQHFIVYPYFSVLLDSNPYISFVNNMMVPSFLSTPSDANAGFTSGNYFNINLTPAAQVPQNTLFTGMLMIQDPNDSTFLCGLPFSFLYGDQLASLPALTDNELRIYPNPSTGTITVSAAIENGLLIITDELGRTIQTAELSAGTATIQLEKTGIYFLHMQGESDQTIQKILIQQ